MGLVHSSIAWPNLKK